MSAPTVSVVIPTLGRPQALRQALSALLALEYPAERYELVVVDDGGGDRATAAVVDSFRGRGVAIELATQDRGGAARARNQGARRAQAEWLLFCDDDILVEPSHLREHLAAHESNEPAAVAGTWELSPRVIATLSASAFGRYRIELERRYLEEAKGPPVNGDPTLLRLRMLSAANFSVRRKLFMQIGGFDEDFPRAGAEDQDFSVRARAAGVTLLLGTRIRCLHDDHHLDRRAYCAREERSASTMPFLVRKHPAQFGEVPYATHNRPIGAGDPPTLVAKKLTKAGLATRPIIDLLHRAVSGCETARMPEPLLRRLYNGLIAVHLFRGFRHSWNA